MAGNVRIVLNPDGPRKLRRHPAVQADLLRRTQAMAARAGDGFEADSAIGANRARAIAYTATHDAVVAESENHALSSSIDAGR